MINQDFIRISLGLPMPSVGHLVTQFFEISNLSAINALIVEEFVFFMAKLLKPEVNQTHATIGEEFIFFMEKLLKP